MKKLTATPRRLLPHFSMMEVKGYSTIFLSVLLFVFIPSTVKGCQDVKTKCTNYPYSACKAPYIGWALNNCKKTCNLCDHSPPGEGNCFDIKPNCKDYLYDYDNFCQGKYKPWAMKVCRWSCKFCSSTNANTNGMSSITKVDIVVPVEIIDVCIDMLDNCSTFPDTACESPEWSVDNCSKRCNLCQKVPLTCADKVASCHPDICTGNYTAWARQYCPVTCNLCGVTTTPKPPTSSTIPLATLLPRLDWKPLPPSCNDMVSDCYSFPTSRCLDKMWALTRCKNRCNLCGAVSDDCVDRGSCEQFRYSALCTGYYRNWVKQYCPKACGYCKSDSKPIKKRSAAMEYAPLPSERGINPGSGSGGCSYQGMKYRRGESWDVGCKWRCTCGQNVCVGICWDWDFTTMPSCYMTPPAPGKCCPTPKCTTNVRLLYPEGYSED